MLFLRALFTLFAYDVLSTFCRFETMYSMVKSWKVASVQSGQDAINRVCTAVNYACIWYPKQALCLQRSFVTTYLAQEARRCRRTWSWARRNCPSRPTLGSRSKGKQSMRDRMSRRPTPFGIAANSRRSV